MEPGSGGPRSPGTLLPLEYVAAAGGSRLSRGVPGRRLNRITSPSVREAPFPAACIRPLSLLSEDQASGFTPGSDF